MDADESRTPAAFPGAPAPYVEYPPQAVEWVVGRESVRVLELGAGSGELTAALCGLDHDVLATDPSLQRSVHLAVKVPAARVAVARAEDIPLPAGSVDTVVIGAGFQEIDAARALPEVARVLRAGGVLALIRNRGDHKVPWVRKMFALMGIGPPSPGDDAIEASDLFTVTDHRAFRQWQRFDRHTLVDFVASGVRAATLSASERSDLLTEAGALYDYYGRGPDGLLMPWMVECYRARVRGGVAHVVATGPTDDGLLIDFY